MKKIRKLSRLGNELHLSASMAVLDWTNGNHDLGVIALLVLSRCADDWINDEAIRRPAQLKRSISIRAVARSLHAPYATIHRQVLQLIARGVVVDLGGGIAISNTPEKAEAVLSLLRSAHDTFLRLIEDIAVDLAVVEPHNTASLMISDIVMVALNTWLIPFEVARTRVVDWTSSLVWLAVVVANVRHITIDREVSELYADTPTPDDVRIPIHVRDLTEMTGLTYGTVYRHCHRLAGLDVVRYDRGGWLTTTRQVNDPQVEEGVRALLSYYAQHINDLIVRGLDVGKIANRYVVGRPPYVALPA